MRRRPGKHEKALDTPRNPTEAPDSRIGERWHRDRTILLAIISAAGDLGLAYSIRTGRPTFAIEIWDMLRPTRVEAEYVIAESATGTLSLVTLEGGHVIHPDVSAVRHGSDPSARMAAAAVARYVRTGTTW